MGRRDDNTLNQDDPTASGFRNSDEENSFDREGRSIWEELKGVGWSLMMLDISALLKTP